MKGRDLHVITVVGSLNIDFITMADRYPKLGETIIGESFSQAYGGKGANQAVAAAKLSSKVNLIGAVGQDTFGDEYLAYLEKQAVSTNNVERVTHHTGTASITIAEEDNAIIVTPGANYSLTPADIDRHQDIIKQSALVLIQLEVKNDTVERALEIAYEAGVPVILNPAPYRTIPNHWWPMVTYFTPNEHELALMLKETTLDDEKRQKIITTRGDKGVTFYDEGEEVAILPPKIHVVDTTGAGDTFNGALAHFLAQDVPLKDALKMAVYAASMATTKLGAQSAMPHLTELQAMVDESYVN